MTHSISRRRISWMMWWRIWKPRLKCLTECLIHSIPTVLSFCLWIWTIQTSWADSAIVTEDSLTLRLRITSRLTPLRFHLLPWMAEERLPSLSLVRWAQVTTRRTLSVPLTTWLSELLAWKISTSRCWTKTLTVGIDWLATRVARTATLWLVTWCRLWLTVRTRAWAVSWWNIQLILARWRLVSWCQIDSTLRAWLRTHLSTA